MKGCSTVARLILLAVVAGLAACGSTPASVDPGEPVAHFDPSKDPYWQDPKWDKTLLDAAQSVVHYPPDDPNDTSTPGLHATVKFTYIAGTIEYPEIVDGTGDPHLDNLMLHQVAAAQVPSATGIDAEKPHEFVLDLDMPTPYEIFQQSIYAAIDYQRVYPKDAVLGSRQGISTVDFDYNDGKATDIVVTKSSDDKLLDKTSLESVTKAAMPASLAAYSGKSFHMEVLFCYALYKPDDKDATKRCPIGKNVILVTGTRIRRTTVFEGTPSGK
jgi:hypothetical protein